MSKEEIPPWLREQLARFDQIQQSLQSIMMQKQQVEAETADIEKAVVELNKIKNDETVYKSAGPLLVRVKRVEILKELQEKKELSKLCEPG
ncbi:MAG: prefoldin subunit beta [Thaumarchaeota archaeon]|nr:prefoldin subunit beta [Nitrososphaerota archaeon]